MTWNNILKDSHSVWLDGHPFYFSYRNPFRLHLWGEAMILKQLQSFSLWNWFSTDYNDVSRVGKDGTHFFAGFINPWPLQFIRRTDSTEIITGHIHTKNPPVIQDKRIRFPLYKPFIGIRKFIIQKMLDDSHEQPSIQSLQK